MSQQRNQTQCQICEKAKSKYKCPNCSIPYCTLQCFKKHKQNQQAKESLCQIVKSGLANQALKQGQILQVNIQQNGQNQLVKTDYIEDESLRLTPQQLSRLSQNQKIKEMLNNKNLKDKLTQIDNSRMRLNLLQQALLNEDFMKFADEALKSVGKFNRSN